MRPAGGAKFKHGLISTRHGAVDDRVDVEYRLPVLPQNVEADVALQIDVRVEDFGVAVDLGRLVRVHGRDGEREVVRRALPEARVRRHDDVEFGQIIGVGKLFHRNLSFSQLFSKFFSTSKEISQGFGIKKLFLILKSNDEGSVVKNVVSTI